MCSLGLINSNDLFITSWVLFFIKRSVDCSEHIEKNSLLKILHIKIFYFFIISRMQFVAQMDVAMGGRAAEELIFSKEKVTNYFNNLYFNLKIWSQTIYKWRKNINELSEKSSSKRLNM